MFGDPDYVGHREQDLHWQRFVHRPVDVALLIGSSGAVPTNDLIAARLQQGGTRVVTINPDRSAGRVLRPDVAIFSGALGALTALDSCLRGGAGPDPVAGSTKSS
jgi:hypothetical protein